MERHGGRRSRLYRIWIDMRRRCYDSKRINYANYGGRGITVCDSWDNSFVPFRDWSFENGYTESLVLDRINNERDYSPDNCRWVTVSQNTRNTRSNRVITLWGETKTMVEWSEDVRCVASYSMLKDRIIKYGWDAERAFTQPRRNYPNSNKK